MWSALFLVVWFTFFALNKRLRKEMLWAGLGTTPLGLSEPLFVPSYWNPPSLFGLAQGTGFDIESLIFSFAVGGLAAVLYKTVFKLKHAEMTASERYQKRHRYHVLALISPIFTFLILALSTDWNHIYCAVAAMFIGGIAASWCRPDLKKNIWVGGFLFLGLYFLFFMTLVLAFPRYVRAVWNLPDISGILMLGIPLEELLFAFTLGMLWAGIYEHIYWHKLMKV